MNNYVNAEEILQIAITIEENGHAFYITALDSISDPNIRRHIQALATWEDGHIARMQDLLQVIKSKDDDFPLFYSSEEDTSLYIRSIGDQHIFLQDGSVNGLLEKCNNVTELLEVALKFEQDSVALYSNLSGKISDEDTKAVIITIANEEKQHVEQIQKLIEESK